MTVKPMSVHPVSYIKCVGRGKRSRNGAPSVQSSSSFAHKCLNAWSSALLTDLRLPSRAGLMAPRAHKRSGVPQGSIVIHGTRPAPAGKGKRSLHSHPHVPRRKGHKHPLKFSLSSRTFLLTMFQSFSSPFHSKSRDGHHRDTTTGSSSERSSRSRMSFFRSPDPSPISTRSRSRATTRSQTPSPNGSHSDLSTATDPPRPPIILGICAMDVKARSKAMREILTRLVDRAKGAIEIRMFGDKVILDEGKLSRPTCLQLSDGC